MSTDPIPAIRHKVESLVKDIDNKYQGMVQVRKLFIVKCIDEIYEMLKMIDWLPLRAKQCKEFDQRSLYRREWEKMSIHS